MSDTAVLTCPVCAREIRSQMAMNNHVRAHERRGETASSGAAEEVPTLPGMEEPDLGAASAPRAPKRRRGLRQVLGWDDGADSPGPPEDRPTRERKPSAPRSTRRLDSSEFFGRIWAAAGSRIERNLGDVPLGRTLQITSGATGVIIDDAVKGTKADKPVQWLVRTEDKVSKLGAVLAAPVLVVMIERNPAAAEALAPFLVDALMAMGPAMVKSLERAEKRRADFAKAMAGIGPALGLPPDAEVTPEVLLSWIFPPVETTPAAPSAAA